MSEELGSDMRDVSEVNINLLAAMVERVAKAEALAEEIEKCNQSLSETFLSVYNRTIGPNGLHNRHLTYAEAADEIVYAFNKVQEKARPFRGQSADYMTVDEAVYARFAQLPADVKANLDLPLEVDRHLNEMDQQRALGQALHDAITDEFTSITSW